VRFKTGVYARRMLRMFTSARVKKIDFAWDAFSAAVDLAKARGLENTKSVADALAKGRALLEPVSAALKAAKEKYKPPVGESPNYDAIIAEMEPHKAAIKTMRSTLDEVEEAVNKANARKSEFEQTFGKRVREGIEDLMALLDQVATVEKDVKEMADTAEKSEVDQCNASCAATRAKIEALRTKDLPELQAKGPGTADLDSTGPIGDPCPQLAGMIAEAKDEVAKTEELALVVLKVRRQFLQAIEELNPARATDREKLEQLSAPAARCNAEGMTHIAALIEKAVSLDDKCEALLSASRDPDGFRVACGEFTAAVAAAEDAVEKGKEDLDRRERERAQRAQLLSMLGEAGELLEEQGTKVLAKVPVQGDKVLEDAKLIHDLGTRVPALRQVSQSADLAECQADVQKLVDQVDRAVSNLQSHIAAELEERRKAFGDKINKWGPLVHQKAPLARAETKVVKKEEDMDFDEYTAHKGGIFTEQAGVLKTLDSGIKELQGAGMSKSDVRSATTQFLNKHFKFNPAART